MDTVKFGMIYTGLEEYMGPVEFAEKAEAWGYDSFWVPDFVTLPRMDALVVLGAVAQRTQGLILGTAVVPMPFRSPFQLAKAALSVDVLSGGRLVLGVGIGVIPRDFEVTQVDFHQRAGITNERLRIIKRLFSEERVTHRGRRHQFEDLTMEPRPVRDSGIPIWIGGVCHDGVAEGVLRRTAKYGDGFFLSDASPAEYRKAQDKIKAYSGSFGRSPEAVQWGLILWTCLGNDKEEARKSAKVELERRLGIPWNVVPENGYALGTPADCIETIEAYLEVGVTHFVFDTVCPPPDMLRQHEVFAKEVIPHFRR